MDNYIDDDINQIAGFIYDLESQEKDINAQIQRAKADLATAIRKKYPVVWAVMATPSDYGNPGGGHVKYAKNYYTTEESANMSMYDKPYRGDNVYWTESVKRRYSSDISDYDILKLAPKVTHQSSSIKSASKQ